MDAAGARRDGAGVLVRRMGRQAGCHLLLFVLAVFFVLTIIIIFLMIFFAIFLLLFILVLRAFVLRAVLLVFFLVVLVAVAGSWGLRLVLAEGALKDPLARLRPLSGRRRQARMSRLSRF